MSLCLLSLCLSVSPSDRQTDPVRPIGRRASVYPPISVCLGMEAPSPSNVPRPAVEAMEVPSPFSVVLSAVQAMAGLVPSEPSGNSWSHIVLPDPLTIALPEDISPPLTPPGDTEWDNRPCHKYEARFAAAHTRPRYGCAGSLDITSFVRHNREIRLREANWKFAAAAREARSMGMLATAEKLSTEADRHRPHEGPADARADQPVQRPVPPCRHGSFCWRPGCYFSHPMDQERSLHIAEIAAWWMSQDTKNEKCHWMMRSLRQSHTRMRSLRQSQTKMNKTAASDNIKKTRQRLSGPRQPSRVG